MYIYQSDTLDIKPATYARVISIFINTDFLFRCHCFCNPFLYFSSLWQISEAGLGDYDKIKVGMAHYGSSLTGADGIILRVFKELGHPSLDISLLVADTLCSQDFHLSFQAVGER